VSTAEGPESERKRFALTISTGGLSGIMGLRGDIKQLRLADLFCYVLIQLHVSDWLASRNGGICSCAIQRAYHYGPVTSHDPFCALSLVPNEHTCESRLPRS